MVPLERNHWEPMLYSDWKQLSKDEYGEPKAATEGRQWPYISIGICRASFWCFFFMARTVCLKPARAESSHPSHNINLALCQKCLGDFHGRSGKRPWICVHTTEFCFLLGWVRPHGTKQRTKAESLNIAEGEDNFEYVFPIIPTLCTHQYFKIF